MCGIFGIITPGAIWPDWVATLGELNSARGNRAFGGFTWSPEAARVFRFNGPFDAARIDTKGARVLLCHIRAPTGGQSDDIREVHPFATPDLLLAHNGILLNHFDFPAWKIDPDLAVDSQVIAGGIQTHLDAGHTIAPAIAQTVGQLNGQQGCWLWDKREATLYLWRVMSSLYYSQRPDQLIFSSVKCHLADRLLPEGRVYQIDPGAGRLSAVAQFAFYTPYKLRS